MLHKIEESLSFLKLFYKDLYSIRMGMVLGSGWGEFINELTDRIEISYMSIPNFKSTLVDGHRGQLIIGKFAGVPLIVFQGRIHAYEGHSMEEVTYHIRLMGAIGVKVLILTNAAGGIQAKFRPGDLVLIKDHINLSGRNPLTGHNINQWGPRFPDMSFVYNKDLRALFKKTAIKNKIKINEGVYSYLFGPTYETPAEIKMLRKMGADMVGMSTVPEVIVAAHMSMDVVGVSCITNMAAGMESKKIEHSDVGQVAKNSVGKFSSLLKKAIPEIMKKSEVKVSTSKKTRKASK